MTSAASSSKRTNGNWSERQLKLAAKAVKIDVKPKKPQQKNTACEDRLYSTT